MSFENLNFMHPPPTHTYWSRPIHGPHAQPTCNCRLRTCMSPSFFACCHPLYCQVIKIIKRNWNVTLTYISASSTSFSFQKKRMANFTSSGDLFLFVIRLELVFLIGASLEISPNHFKPRVRPIPQKKISFEKDLI